MEQRRPARSYCTRRPARSYNPRRPTRSYWTRRPARSYWTRRPARSYNPRRPARSYWTRRPARSYNPRRPARSYCTTGIGLKACSGVEVAEKGEQTRTHLVKVGLEGEVFITSAVVDMRENWSNRKDASNLFEKMTECAEVPWRSHGDVRFVYPRKEEVKRMNGYPLALSRTCSISATSEQAYIGYAYFTSMNGDYGVTPGMDYCTCMVGLLGQAGELTDAETPIKEMPFSLDIVVWPTLPGACTILGKLEFGALVAQHIFELDPQDDISDGMLSSIYVGEGILDEVAEVRKLANDWRARREAVCSWIKANDKSHFVMVGDPSISQIDEMYVKLERLTEETEGAGYMPDTKYMFHIVEMDKKECYLTYHSIKLTIAFGFTDSSA